MKLDKALENKIKKVSLFYMEKGRPGWNVPHLYAAVFYMKKLIKLEGGDERILLSAIYLHDIGYAGLLNKGYTFRDNDKVKKDHMIKGAKMSKKILNDFKVFSKDEIKEICRLVKYHDNLKKINDFNSQMVFEADSLAQLDKKKVKPTFNKKDYRIWINKFNKKRAKMFKTKTGKYYLRKLLPIAKNYYSR